MSGVIVDTSAWIAFFRSSTGQVGDAIVRLIEEDRAYLTGPVLAELLQGTKTPREAARLNQLLASLPYLECVRADWEQAGETLAALRRRGVALPLTDALISAVAVRVQVRVLTLDRHFTHLPAQLLDFGF